MKKLNTYSYMSHFYQTAGPFYDDLLVKVKDRQIENLPLDGIYQFRFFDSNMQIDEIYEIVEKVSDTDVLRQIKDVVNLSKWYYIGDELSNEKKLELINIHRIFGDYERLKKAQRIIDPKIYGIHPIIIDSLEDVGEVYDTSCREKSSILVRNLDSTRVKWL